MRWRADRVPRRAGSPGTGTGTGRARWCGACGAVVVPVAGSPAARWPWGTSGVVAGSAAAAPWWNSVEVARAPAGPDRGPALGGAVPVTGPAARDTDGDGLPDTLVLDGPAGASFWIDLDGDGLADRSIVPVPADPGASLPGVGTEDLVADDLADR